MKNIILLLGLILVLVGFTSQEIIFPVKDGAINQGSFDYQGTASITQGLTQAHQKNVFECLRGRPTDVGLIRSSDGKEWTVPSNTNFNNDKFPSSSDLHNPCNGNTYSNAQEAISKLDGSDIIEIDKNGETYTAYIFADNYFEMFVNGVPVGKDKVPFTQFNSSIVRFTVNRPFTISMKLVDWEESLGIGTEKNRRSDFHAGDGGMVAVIKDEKNNIIATTNEYWKAQTFYTSPIKDLSCVSEIGLKRLSQECDHKDSNDGTAFYGLHWELPRDWQNPNYDDSQWPNASIFSNNTIGVDNKKSYTNFTDIFDNQDNDAKFIWSTNVVLDNEVIVRYTVN